MIEYPDNPPEWLAHWVTNEEMERRFPLSMQMLAKRVLLREASPRLSWGKRTLRVTVGNQSCSWRREDDGSWTPKCTCNSPTACIHAYMAHLLLRMVSKERKWPFPQETNQPQEAPRLQEECQEPISSPPARPANPSPQQRKHSLRIEWNIHTKDDGVSVQFFDCDGDTRELLYLNWLRNLAARVCAGQDDNLWNEADTRFFQWIVPILRQRNPRLLFGNTLQLSRDEAREWILHWKENPSRFFDRLTGEPLFPIQPTPVRTFHLELTKFEQEYHLCAFFLADEQKRLHVHQLCELFRKDPSGLLRELLFAEYSPPIPWNVLQQYFGKGTLTLKHRDVCNVLPQITGGQLNLLLPNKLVRFTERKLPEFEIMLAMDDSNAFVLTLLMEGKRMPFQRKTTQLCDIQPSGEGFLVRTSSSPVLQLLHRHLEELLRRAGPALLPSQDRIRIIATMQSAILLREFWKALPPTFSKRHSPTVQGIVVEAPAQASLRLRLRENHGLVQLSTEAVLNETPIRIDELQRIADSAQPLYHHPSRGWLSIDLQDVRRCLATAREQQLDGEGKLMLKNEAAKLARRLPAELSWEDESLPLARKLIEEQLVETPPIPQKIAGILRNYQRNGVRFLLERVANEIGAILADDMGLGKTLQILTVIEALRARNPQFRALVVCPASVIDTWVEQASRFCPALTTTPIRGARLQREKQIRMVSNLMVTHYALLRADIDLLRVMQFDLVIVDEAQAIKNPTTALSQAVRMIPANVRVAVTGTPLENSMRDVCAILDFVSPRICGPLDLLMGSWLSMNMQAHVQRVLDVLMLRRTKEMVAPELPPKTEETVFLEMNEETQMAYLEELVSQREAASGGGTPALFAAIMRLRRFCCAPRLVQKPFPSPKIEYLTERGSELLASGHSILVFSQFTSLLALLEESLNAQNLPWLSITGETPVAKRAMLVQEFNESETPKVFLLSLKAAGTGLNLTKADYVFLFDPWWNPAVENQAIDRTHRIGQEHPVFAYRLILRDTVEEKVLRILAEKRELFHDVIDGSGASETSPLSLEEIKGLLS